MKRYQCIKNVYMPSAAHGFTEGSEQILCFKQGAIYQEYVNDSWSELSDEHWNIHMITPELMVNFKELPPIDDQEEEEARAVPITTKDTRRISLGCAIIIVTFLTVLALIFFR